MPKITGIHQDNIIENTDPQKKVRTRKSRAKKNPDAIDGTETSTVTEVGTEDYDSYLGPKVRTPRKRKEDMEVILPPDLGPPLEGPEYIGSFNDLKYKGGELKMWCWNCDGIRSVMRNGKFEKFVELVRP